MSNEILVQKRDGRFENYDIAKIKNIISFATKDLRVNPLTLEATISSKVKNKIKTSEIQFNLIQSAVSLITIDEPDWSIVAGRLDIYNLHREVYKLHKINYPNRYIGRISDNLIDFIKLAIKYNLYDKVILERYSEDEINEIEKYINPEYDMIFPISSTKSLLKKYLIKHKGKSFELPQFANIVIAMFLNQYETKDRLRKIKDDYEAIASLKISLATPFKANLRKPNANLSSCFVTEIDDNAESINHTLKNIAMISKNGGGVGVYLGRIRPSNSLVKNYAGANVINVWVKIIDDMAPAWNQGGVRQGAITVSLDIFHKDIESFIEMKTESGGDVRQKCYNIFPQVIINSKFIEAVKNDKEFPLVDRKTILDDLDIDVCDLKQFNDNYDLIVSKIKDKKLYNCELTSAKELWKKLLRIYIETGDLYIVCKDAMNKTNPFYDAGYYTNSANLCTESYSPARPSTNFKKHYNKETNEASETFTPGRTHTCNLISLNVSDMSLKDIENYSKQAVRMLDNAIDVTNVPLIEGEILTEETRIIGVGILGLADHLAFNKKSYEIDQDYIENIFELVSYYTLESSIEIAEEKGSFGIFDKSSFKNKKYLGKTGQELMEQSLTKSLDWVTLLERASKGVRNSQLFAVAPNTSSSLLCASSASYLPIFSKFSYETLDKMNVPVVPKFLSERFWYYKEYTNIPVKTIIELTNKLHKWVDTGLSLETIISPEKDSIKDISDALLDGFSDNLKALYYSRTIDKQSSSGCSSCAN